MALNLGPAPERSRTPAILIALAVLTAIGVGLNFFIPHKPVEIQLQKVDLYAPHTELLAAKGGMHVLGTLGESEDDLYVVATVALVNKVSVSQYLDVPNGEFTSADGVMPATIISASDIPRLEQAFPAITPLAVHPLHDGDEITPAATLHGTVVLLFPHLNEAAWRTRKSATLTIRLRSGDKETLTLR